MTMLDRMRQHRNWLKWSLALVCLAFVVFYIPDFLSSNQGAVATDTVAVVEGEPIRSDEFMRTYQVQLQSYRAAYGANVSEQLLKQLGIEQQIMQQLVDERAALAEANRLGLTVSDDEVAQRIYAIPAFQENGVFVGAERYQAVLAGQRPPLTTAEFENSLRRSLLVDKLRATVTDWVSVSDKELEREYRRRNDRIKLMVVAFTADAFRKDVTASDADVTAYFNAHTNDFRIPEKRKVRYVLIDLESLRTKITVTQADVERAYNDARDQYTTPEQVRASHILFRTEGKDDATIRKTAEDVLKQAKSGADFATLAQKYSEDLANAKNGGDLDFFGKGRMVPQFDQVAFGMEVGQISDLVKTEYGYHIIKLTDKRPGTTRSLDEVRQQLTDQILAQRSQAQAADMAQRIEAQVKTPADLENAAKSQGLTVQETGFFARDEPILSVGGSPEMNARAFSMKEGEVSGALRAGRGFAFEALVAKQDAYVPKIDEVKDRVRDEVIRQRALDLAKQKATDIAARLKSAPDFEKAAKAAGVEAKTTELLTRDSQIPDLGAATDVLDAAFKLQAGNVSDPIATATGTAVVKVVEKQETTESGFANAKESFRGEMLNDRRTRFFDAYLVKAKQKMKIEVNREALQRVIG